VLPTETGVGLIDLIDNELLKSAELTGLWEKRLKEIERGEFKASTFIHNMKKMVYELVHEVRANNTVKRITSNIPDSIVVSRPKSKPKKVAIKSNKEVVGRTCLKCKKGILIKGGNAYGCSEYKNNCDFKIPFIIYGKKVSENQLVRLIDKGSTTNLKGFTLDSVKVEGLIQFDAHYHIKLEEKDATTKTKKLDTIVCPKCKKGTILKGKSAYGCSNYKVGCNFIFTFENIRTIANGKPLTKELVLEIISK
jgi:DNA topoisomerase-3